MLISYLLLLPLHNQCHGIQHGHHDFHGQHHNHHHHCHCEQQPMCSTEKMQVLHRFYNIIIMILVNAMASNMANLNLIIVIVSSSRCAAERQYKSCMTLGHRPAPLSQTASHCHHLRHHHPYMQKTCDVAEMAILAKKNCGKSA